MNTELASAVLEKVLCECFASALPVLACDLAASLKFSSNLIPFLTQRVLYTYANSEK
jgi:hypothetical protein